MVLLLLITLPAFAALCVALLVQYVGGLPPCDLCVYQRIPYVALIVLGCIGYLLHYYGRPFHLLRVLAALLYACVAGLAAYHTAVEYGVVSAPSACSQITIDPELAADAFWNQVQSSTEIIVSCKDALAYFMGLSLALWNLLYAGLWFVVILAYPILQPFIKKRHNIL